MGAITVDFSADLEFVLIEKQLLQIVLHLRQDQVKVTFREQVVNGPSAGFGLDGTLHCQGEGAYLSLQAGDISLDLAEDFYLQSVFQKSKVMADTS